MQDGPVQLCAEGTLRGMCLVPFRGQGPEGTWGKGPVGLEPRDRLPIAVWASVSPSMNGEGWTRDP